MTRTKPAPGVFIGTAGWSLRREDAAAFPSEGSMLQRYGAVFSCVEINSSFYRPHKKDTYARWAMSVPETFRFSVKLPKAISHESRLMEPEAPLMLFLDAVAMLGGRLGAVLVQLPPSLAFDATVANRFFALCRAGSEAKWVCEPRHRSWFGPEATSVLAEHDIALVGADPAKIAGSGEPVVRGGIAYWRLHGSPSMYYSAYSPQYLQTLARQLVAIDAEQVWCILDNTAAGAAVGDALSLMALARRES